MLNQKLKASLSVGFVGCCFAIGFGASLLTKFEAQRLQKNEIVKTATASLESREKRISATKKQNAAKSITIKAVGDVIPGTNYPHYRLPADRNQLIPKPVRAYLSEADVLFGNFETTLTKHRYSAKDVSRGQVFAFRSPPEYAKLFSDVGFDVFNIANNHARDFGMVGFNDTMKNLENAGIETLGHKNQILFLEKNNNKIAMIGFAP